MFFNSKKMTSYLVIIAAFSLAGCGKTEQKTNATQVAAKVNDVEISMHQINLLMKNAPNLTAENAPAARQQILEKLIDQQIVVEKANKENLDRMPDVMMAIEAAKKDILARAYLQKMVSTTVKISDSEVKKYFDEHPGLFSKRRIYNLQDIGLESNPEVLSLLKQEVSKQKSMQEIAETLKQKGIKFSAGAYTRPAEQIPLDVLPSLVEVKDGDTVVLEVANAIHVIRVVKTQSAPIDLTAATPFIKNFFMNTRGKQAVEEEMKKYRKEAKVEYLGDFANKPPAESKQESALDSKVAKPADEKAAKKSVIEAGVAGLK